MNGGTPEINSNTFSQVNGKKPYALLAIAELKDTIHLTYKVKKRLLI